MPLRPLLLRSSVLCFIVLGTAALPQHVNASGIPVWSGTGTQFASSYWSALQTDATANGGVSVPAVSTYTGDNFGIFAVDPGNGNPPQKLGFSTMNRICSLIAPNDRASSFTEDNSWYGNGSGTIIMWDYSGDGHTANQWRQDDANDPNGGCPGGGDSCHYSFEPASTLSCSDSITKPTPTLTISKNNISIGQSATITWTDAAAIDKNSTVPQKGGVVDPYPTIPDPVQEAIGVPHSGQITGEGDVPQLCDFSYGNAQTTTNGSFPPNAVCTAWASSGANWTNHIKTNGHWNSSCSVTGCYQDGDGNYHCADDETFSWVGDVTTTGESKSGSVSTGIMNTAGTYTYYYSCTNVNGTTQKAVTLTVGGSALLPDYTIPQAPTITGGDLTPGSTLTFAVSEVDNDGSANATSTSDVRLLVEKGTTIDNNATSYGTTDHPVAAIAAGQNSGVINDSAFNQFQVPANAQAGDVYSYEACADQPPTPYGVIGEGTNTGETNNCGPVGQFTVVQPDLTADNAVIQPNPAIVNQSVAITANIYNQGGGSTDASFHNVFEINPNSIPPDFAHIADVLYPDSDPMSALDAGSSQQITLSTFTFPTPGTWYVRACADTNKSNVGTITESNENNNCSTDQGDGNKGWTPVTVTYPPATCTLTANPNPVQNGGSTQLVWTSQNAASCICSWPTGTCGLSGTSIVTPTTNPSNYSVTCSDPAGNAGPACPVSVTIASSCGQNPSVTLTPNKPRVADDTGDPIAYKGTGVTAPCSLNGPNIGGAGDNSIPLTVSQCNIPPGNTTPNPTVTAQSTYNLVCNSVNLATTTIDILPNYNEF